MVEYYTLEKTAEMLKMTPAEVHRLREQGKLRGFRDGSDWKFIKDEIDQHLLTQIKERHPSDASPLEIRDDLLTSDEENFDPILADSASFDALVDQSLVSDGLVSNGIAPTNFSPDEEMTLMADGNFNIDDGLVLSDHEETPEQESLSGDLQLSDEPIEIFDIKQTDSDINLSGDSGISLVKKGSSGSIDLADDDDLVLGGSGGIGGSDINLAGDSGVSLIDAAAESDFAISESLAGSDAILELAPDDDILALVGDDVDADTATVLGTEDDFQLSIDLEADDEDDSESSSQVIAIEDDLADDLGLNFQVEPTTPSGVGAITSSDEDLLFSIDDTAEGSGSESIEIDAFTGFDSEDSQESVSLDLGDFSSGFDASEFSPIDDTPAGGTPFAAATITGEALDTVPSQPTATSSVSGNNEPFFSGASVSGLTVVFFLLFFAGTLIFDLIRNMWSWQEPFILNSAIMNALKGILG